MTPARPELSALTGYAGNELDRLGNQRDDAAYVADCAQERGARIVLFAAGNPVLRTINARLTALHPLQALSVFDNAPSMILLGRDAIGPIFASWLDDNPPDFGVQTATLDASIDLRTLGSDKMLPRSELGLLAQAKSLVGWHLHHQFCARCGHQTTMAQAGWRRECTACDAQHFPRTDPVVIMLVTHGDDCLLARQPRFAPGVYSCLAGFVEPGETIEDAVRREVMEEAGIAVGSLEYLASQPWPFPSSLMIGCHGRAQSRNIVIDALELEDARWFGKGEIETMRGRTHAYGLTVPPQIAIARTLLDDWMAK